MPIQIGAEYQERGGKRTPLDWRGVARDAGAIPGGCNGEFPNR